MDFCTVADIRNFLKIKQNVDDGTIQAILSAVSVEMEVYLDRTILIGTQTEVLDVDRGQTRFQLKAYPVSAVTSVKNAYDRDFAAATAIASTDYYVNLDMGVITIDKFLLTPGPGVMQIAYTGGMAVDTSDFKSKFQDLKMACMMESSFRYQRKAQLGVVSAAVAGGSVTMVLQQQFLPAVIQILDRHMRVG